MLRIVACVVVSTIVRAQASATVVSRCSASAGYAYYFAGPLVPADKAGWRKDGVTGGSLQLLRDGNDYDIVYTDASGGSRSVRADGFEVIAVPRPQSSTVLIIGLHPTTGVLEHWLFSLDPAGRGNVVWGTARPSNVQKSALYEATCASP